MQEGCSRRQWNGECNIHVTQHRFCSIGGSSTRPNVSDTAAVQLVDLQPVLEQDAAQDSCMPAAVSWYCDCWMQTVIGKQKPTVDDFMQEPCMGRY